MRRAIALDYIVCQIPFKFLQQSKIAKIVKVYDAIPSFRIYYPIQTRFLGIVQIYDALILIYFFGNVVRIRCL